MKTLTVTTETHGRVLVEAAASGNDPARWLLAFHGYAQNADDVLAEVLKIPGIDGWNVAAVQALHRFYTRRDERVVANWMTRQDREQAIEDNVAYVNRVVGDVARPDAALVFLGFSQGAAMAYRAAMLGRREAAGVIALGGDVPPEFKAPGAAARGETPALPRRWPAVLVGAGHEDPWYTPERCDEDERALLAQQTPLRVVRFRGGHEWTAEFRDAASAWLAGVGGDQ